MIRNAYAYFGFGAVVAAGLGAAYIGLVPEKPAEQPSAPVNSSVEPSEAPVTPDGAKPSAAVPATPSPTQPTPALAEPVQQNALAPSFDILRVEPNGSIVIAGKAVGSSNVDVIAGSKVLGSAKTGAGGDFAIVLDQALKPGDYQLVLRSTAENGTVMTSLETAVVSIPDNENGQVLALVEQPGSPSRMITKPKAETAEVAPSGTEPPASVEPGTPAVTATDTPAKAPAVAASALVAVEAVEIEGNKIFIAGSAQAGKRVNIYANDKLLGSAIATPDNRFLVQTEQSLPVGDYIFRADMTAANSNDVIARAAVPFHREAGENIAAVAPAASANQPAPVSPDSKIAAAFGQNNEAQAPTAEPLQKADGSVIIRRGDTLWTISRRVYGQGIRYSTIYLANSDQIKDPDLIWPGQIFALPKPGEEPFKQGG